MMRDEGIGIGRFKVRKLMSEAGLICNLLPDELLQLAEAPPI